MEKSQDDWIKNTILWELFLFDPCVTLTCYLYHCLHRQGQDPGQEPHTWFWAACSPGTPWHPPPCCQALGRSLALAVNKALRDVLLHILIPALGCLFGLVKWPPGARVAILCVLGLLLVTVKAIMLLSCLTKGQRSLWGCQSKGPGAGVLCMHIHAHKYVYSCHPDLLIHLSF